jgi:uncharacterized protein (DUF1810 family)
VSDRFDLQRFVDAQDPVIDRVRTELRNGRKASHWMWFVFPQISGLGHSDTARFYAIYAQDEAKAYLAHPILGARLKECTEIVNLIEGRSAHEIFDVPDDKKFHSSMTLFAAVAPNEEVFAQALQKYFGGKPDQLTIKRL